MMKVLLRPFLTALTGLSAWAALPAAGQSPDPARPASCRMAPAEESWLRTALDSWPTGFRKLLGMPAIGSSHLQSPRMVLFDAWCSFEIPEGGARPWQATPHEGDILLPSGKRMKVQPDAHTADTSAGRFVVMSLPSIWRTFAPPSDIPLDLFLEAVLVHELAHDYQFKAAPSTTLAADRTGDTNRVQQAMKGDAAYAAAFAAERDLFYRAVSAPDDATARTLACAGLERLERRQTQYFVGNRAGLREIDDLSLNMEGFAQWTMHAWLTRHRKLSSGTVTAKLRSSSWALDEGLAIYLLIDRLVPGWPGRALGRRPEGARALLTRACGR